MVLALTHEEAITYHVAQVVRSYRELPLLLYHFQTKERDEARPRAGVLRTREFIMKDAYSFDRDRAGLDASYEKFVIAYDRVFDRVGLEWYRVESDVGAMGGFGAHEYMAPCPAGENDVALAPGYAANVEIATADAQPVELPAPTDAPQRVETPGMTTIEAVATHLSLPAGALLKAFPVVVEDDRGMVMVVVRGDHRVNEIKLANALRAPFRAAQADEVEQRHPVRTRVGSPPTVEAREVRDVLDAGDLVRQPQRLGENADSRADVVGAVGADPVDREPTRRRPQDGRQDPNRRRLSGPVRTEESHHVPGTKRERQPSQRGPTAIRHREVLGDEDGSAGVARRRGALRVDRPDLSHEPPPGYVAAAKRCCAEIYAAGARRVNSTSPHAPGDP
jgi:prolyl-tRNA synthetase